jgi:hypothetical protein
MPIYVLDEMTVPPGRLREVRSLLGERYRRGAEARGLHLERICMTPPVELDDEPTTLLLWWTLADIPAFWAMKRSSVGDPGVAAFWREVDDLVVSRSRRFAAPLDEPDGRN